jgi:7-cyano-7-deazaguanine synthase
MMESPSADRRASGAGLVLLSGGQDSAVCLASALSRYGLVETVGFTYGQRHSVEMECRPKLRDAIAAAFPNWAPRLGPDHLIDLSVLGQISDTAMTSEAEITFNANGLPNTFVPGRNLLFFTMAAALAYRRGIRHLIGGMCQTDYSGYPDCRRDTLTALNNAINLGMAERFVIETPLMWRTKAETWALTEAIGGGPLVEIVVEHTHTCYKGDRAHRYDWGYGCGECPACVLRAKGYEDWREEAGAIAVGAE